jgi:hypothetical protein
MTGYSEHGTLNWNPDKNGKDVKSGKVFAASY